MSEEVSPLERDHLLCVVLPGGLEKSVTVHGSKPLMDFIVTFCASNHLNPSDYTVDILSPNKSNISFKPNSTVGSLEAEKIVLKPKGMEEKPKGPYVPEATIRLLINYNKSHKTVLRVNPKLPLQMLLPSVCDKCEFKVETTILLKDSQSKEPLDLTKSLNDHGLKEVFAKDTGGKDLTDHRQPKTAETAEVISPPPLQDLPKKEKKWKENKGFFSLFRRRKKKHEMGAVSAPASPGPRKQAVVRMNSESISSSNTLPIEKPKKRRAPLPPIAVSQSVNNFSICNLGGAQSSEGSTLRSTKRRAPPPPCANTLQELPADTKDSVLSQGETVNSLNTLEELKESDESERVNRSPSSLAHPLQPKSGSSSLQQSLAHLHEVTDPYLPMLRGKDFSSARCNLAKVLMSSVSREKLVRRLKNSATFPKFQNGPSFMSMTPRCPNSEVFCTGVESAFKSNLPTESEWEDPAEKRGMTTFKVIPLKKTRDVTRDLPDQCCISSEDNPESKTSHEVGNNQADTDEKRYSPDTAVGSEDPAPSPDTSSQQIQLPDNLASRPLLHDLTDQNLPSPPLSEARDKEREEVGYEVSSEVISGCSYGEVNTEDHIHSEPQKEFVENSSADTDQSSACADETKVEDEVVQEEEEKEEGSFPAPPPPVFFNEDIEIMENEREDTTSSSLRSSQISSPTVALNGQINVFRVALQDEPTSPRPEQNSLDKKSAAPSRFAQAVAIAVQRSQCSKGPQLSTGPHGLLPSPPRSTYQYGA
ncbi:protein cordon-bleu isoform X3 [Oreochromis aureus]|uniref:protein cordon-bleu isoform X3 n=1 Tax=Oreochromis aureus TaxID=47969 RepID=UPI0019538A31|nr:protein cordon-bleu isoform X3 [Oreochromis aureus]